jgi:serine/threonine protein kinase/Tfp pilus assembly protein PilF
VFGDYLLVDRIAQGGMAELFLAKRRGVEGFEKIVAIKRILPELSWNREFVSMFINEAKIAARLSHPNIVQIFDFGKIESYYFIAMEYVHGENLRELGKSAIARQIPISQQIAASIVARACAGLEHAHKKMDENGRPLRIIHRDVSPQNVLVSFEGEVKVVDFGIAKAVAENPEATRGVLKGKLSYLSPEQVNGLNLDARSDIFAMGLVLYELLMGKKLFDGNDPGEILDGIVHVDSNEVAKAVPHIDRRVRDVLRRSLHVDPNQRFASAGEMQIALDQYLRDSGDPGGTMQLANIMRLVFDKRMGENTERLLRAQVLGKSSGSGARSGSPKRLIAALVGGALGAAALMVAAPSLRQKPVEVAPIPDSKPPIVDPKPAKTPKVMPRATEAPPPVAPSAAPADEPTAAPRPQETKPSQAALDRVAAEKEIEQASAAMTEDRPADAVVAFEKAFGIVPSLRPSHAAAYAKALTEEGKSRFETDVDAAAQRFKAAIAADASYFDAHFFLAKAHTRKSEPALAEREYKEAVRINPKSADAQFNLGFVYFSQKRYDDARKQYEKVVELKPPYLADVFYNLAACYEQMKRKSDAIETLRRGVKAVPDSDLLRQRLNQLGG